MGASAGDACEVELRRHRRLQLVWRNRAPSPGHGAGDVPRVQAYWLRCRMVEPMPGRRRTRFRPGSIACRLESRGITTLRGTRSRSRTRCSAPPTARPGNPSPPPRAGAGARSARDHLIVAPPGGATGELARGRRLRRFRTERPSLRARRDRRSMTLGPALLQPDGSVYRFGAIPPGGRDLSFRAISAVAV